MNQLAVAVLDGSVVDIISAITYVHPDKPFQVFLNELGVASTPRRLGIGRQLMEFMLDRGMRLGCTETCVGTEVDNEAALALYRTTGKPVEEHALIFTYIISPNGQQREREDDTPWAFRDSLRLPRVRIAWTRGAKLPTSRSVVADS